MLLFPFASLLDRIHCVHPALYFGRQIFRCCINGHLPSDLLLDSVIERYQQEAHESREKREEKPTIFLARYMRAVDFQCLCFSPQGCSPVQWPALESQVSEGCSKTLCPVPSGNRGAQLLHRSLLFFLGRMAMGLIIFLHKKHHEVLTHIS